MPATAPVAVKRVLVADDTAFVRDRFKAALEAAGHQAITVQTAGELLASMRNPTEPIDLLVLDLRLPHAQGVDVVRSIRQMEEGRVPIVVFSGTIAHANEVRELSALGVCGYVNEYSSMHHIVPSLTPHLCPNAVNRRSSPRVLFGVPVSYRFGNTIAAALTLNISSGGLAIRTTSPLAAGTDARVRFRLPGGGGEVDAQARVTWTDRRVGMGLQFMGLDCAQQAAIDAFVEAHFFSNRKA